MRAFCLFALIWIILPSTTQGQQRVDPDSVKHRNDCRLAERVLSTGHPRPHRDWALRIVVSCGPGAARAVAELWKSPPSDTAALTQVFLASSRFRDARIYNAAFEAVMDPAKPDLVRVTALGVLASYAQPGVLLQLDRLTRVSSGLFTWQNAFARMGHPLTEEGEVPLPADVSSRVNRLVNELASAPAGTPVRDSAFHLKYLLGFR